MVFKIVIGEHAAQTHPACDLYVDNYLAKYDKQELEELFIFGEVLDDPTDEQLAQRLDRLAEREVEVITTLQGRYGLTTLPKIVLPLLERGFDVTINIAPLPETIRRPVGAPKIVLEPPSEDSESLPRPLPPDRVTRRMRPDEPLRVFLCYSSADRDRVRLVHRHLMDIGVDVWFDEEKLIAGQDWRFEIEAALSRSDLIVVCVSRSSIDKVGFVQKELRYALDYADEQPESSIFIVPLKLEECEIPLRLRRWQWVDYTTQTGRAALERALDARFVEVRRRRQERGA